MSIQRDYKASLFDVIEAPYESEKSVGAQQQNKFTFAVRKDSNKKQIKDAVEYVFGVTVDSVNTLVRKGKTKRNMKTGKTGQQSDIKKAVVTLKKGQTIDLSSVKGGE